MTNTREPAPDDAGEYVTVLVAEQLFGLPIAQVHDVFLPERLTRVPLAPPEIAGVLNLRGRIVTAIDLRRRLGLPGRGADSRVMAVGIEWEDESYCLLVDAVGEVMKLTASSRERSPANLDARWKSLAAGVHRLEGQLLVMLDLDRVLAIGGDAAAA